MNDAEKIMITAIAQGIFRVDADGRIWRTAVRTRTGRVRPIKERRAEELRPDGYSNIRLQVDGREYQLGAHRLVWLSLHGDIAPGMEINHRDGARSANALSNLEPVTPGDNLQHSYDQLGRVRMGGERNGRHKLTAATVREIHVRREQGESKRSLSRRFGVSPPMIRRILAGTAWRDEYPQPQAIAAA